MNNPFLFLLVQSSHEMAHWRTNVRNTWAKNLPENVKLYFLIEGSTPCQDEEDTIVVPTNMYSNRSLSAILCTSIVKALSIDPEWIGVVADNDYIMVDRLLQQLKSGKEFVGYKDDRAFIWFARYDAIQQISTERQTMSIPDGLKYAGFHMYTPPYMTHPVRVPKSYNPIIACLRQRPDKLERLHKRLDHPHVAILTICLGRYDRFFGGWYESTQEFFLHDCTRHYYVWEDSKHPLPYSDLEYCTFIKQENLGYYNNNLYRFKMFLDIKEELMQYDFVYFSQVTGRCRTYLGEKDLIPSAEEDNFLIARNIDMPEYFTHDEQPNSTACVDKSKARFYAQGGLYGGTPQEFIAMCEKCLADAEENERRGVSAWLKDESHLNKYFFDKNPKQTWLRFWWPPTKEQSEKCSYYTLEKKRYGGFLYLRQPDTDENCTEESTDVK